MESIRAFYESSTKISRIDLQWLKYILAVLPPYDKPVMLDIGCFDGSNTIQLRDALRASETFGVDFMREKLAEAEARGIRTQWADLNSGQPLDLPDASFDVIVCSEVIEHVYSPDDLLENIYRLLKPGGCAVITTPNLASWKNRLILLLGWQPFFTEVSARDHYGNPLVAHGKPSGHIRVFTFRALGEMLKAHKLKIVRTYGVSFPSPQKNLTGLFSRTGDWLFTRFITAADRIILSVTK